LRGSRRATRIGELAASNVLRRRGDLLFFVAGIFVARVFVAMFFVAMIGSCARLPPTSAVRSTVVLPVWQQAKAMDVGDSILLQPGSPCIVLHIARPVPAVETTKVA
jgi:hypothetical protein